MHISDDYYPIKNSVPMETADQVEKIMKTAHCSEETAALIVLATYVKNLEEVLRHSH